jgi:hypothetical protein
MGLRRTLPHERARQATTENRFNVVDARQHRRGVVQEEEPDIGF